MDGGGGVLGEGGVSKTKGSRGVYSSCAWCVCFWLRYGEINRTALHAPCWRVGVDHQEYYSSVALAVTPVHAKDLGISCKYMQ